MRIILDCDDVLADFVGGAARLWGVDPADLAAAWEPGEWGIEGPLSRALDRAASPVTPGEFWDRVNNYPNFWRKLDRTPWFDDLVRLAKEATDDWWVVTAPSRDPLCYAGKAEWLKAHFGRTFDRFHVTRYKYLFAGPGAVLIDDRDGNIEEFEHGADGKPTGGVGITFPRMNNSLWSCRADPVGYVRKQLEYLREREKADASPTPR